MDDEKTLKIKVVYGSDSDRKPPAESTPPKEPKTPSSPPSPPSPARSSLPENFVPSESVLKPHYTSGEPHPEVVEMRKGPQGPMPPKTPASPLAPAATTPPPPKAPATITPPVAATITPAAQAVTPVAQAAVGGGAIPPAGSAVAGAGAVPPAAGGAAVVGGGAAAAGAGLSAIIAPAMIVVGAVVAAFGALVTATTLVSGIFARMSEHLKEYDPGIAIAEGISEMRKIQADIKAAGERSNDVQAITKARTDIDVTMTSIETQITKILGPAAVRLLAIAEKFLQLIEYGLKAGEKIWEELSDLAENPQKHPLVAAALAPLLLLVKGFKEVMKLLDAWLKIQLDDDMDASKFQKDIIDALNPHRSDIVQSVNRHERGRTPRGVQL